MHHIFGMRPDGAEDSEYRLHEKGWLHETPVGEMREVVQVPGVVALELESRAVAVAGLENVLDILERVPEDKIPGGLEVRLLPIVFEGLVFRGEMVEAEVERAHVER